MLLFTLFRIKLVQKTQQFLLLETEVQRSTLIKDLIMSRPSAELRKGYNWHIGNIQQINDASLYFALGRTTKTIEERYDYNTQNFIEEEFEHAPYTHVIVNVKYQILLIAKKARLSPTTSGIAKRLANLINQSEKIKKTYLRAEISEIDDPDDFIKYIEEASVIYNFTMDFGLPNTWDVNEDFQKPLEMAMSAIDGEDGTITFRGDGLEATTVIEMARATAAVGKNAKAQIESNGRKTTKQLKGNPIVIEKLSIDEEYEKEALAAKAVEIYKKIWTKR